MKLFPFILNQKQGALHMTNLCVFLAHGGRSFWQTEEESISSQKLEQEYLLPNGLIPKRIHFTKEIVYIWIDAEKTKISDFYGWEEAYKHPDRPECWRSFYFFQDSAGTPWFSHTSQPEGEIEGKPISVCYEDILRLVKE